MQRLCGDPINGLEKRHRRNDEVLKRGRGHQVAGVRSQPCHSLYNGVIRRFVRVKIESKVVQLVLVQVAR